MVTGVQTCALPISTALEDAATAARTSLGTNTAWILNDLPILPLAHLGWSARPAVGLHRSDGTSFSFHPETVTHTAGRDEAAVGTVHTLTSTGTDPAHGVTVVCELRLEASGLAPETHPSCLSTA